MNEYKGYPPSVAELRSDKTLNSNDWTPRDVLISVLRDIDEEKINPSCLIVGCASVRKDGGVLSHFYLSAPDSLTALGLVECIKERMQRSKE